jgi:hypothetical protein
MKMPGVPVQATAYLAIQGVVGVVIICWVLSRRCIWVGRILVAFASRNVCKVDAMYFRSRFPSRIASQVASAALKRDPCYEIGSWDRDDVIAEN